MNTELVRKLKISENAFKKYAKQWASEYNVCFIEKIKIIFQKIQELYSKRLYLKVYSKTELLCIDMVNKRGIMFPRYLYDEKYNIQNYDFNELFNGETICGSERRLPTQKILEQYNDLITDILKWVDIKCFLCEQEVQNDLNNEILEICCFSGDYKRIDKKTSILKSELITRFNNVNTLKNEDPQIIQNSVSTIYDICCLSIINFEYDNLYQFFIKYIVRYGLLFETLTSDLKEYLSDLFYLYDRFPGCVFFTEKGDIQFYGGDRLIENYNPEKDQWANELHWKLVEYLKLLYKEKAIEFDEQDFINMKIALLNCEKIRADIEPYEDRLLTDPNRGHWDLWDNRLTNSDYWIEISEGFVARNPICDVNKDGVIAIDFGTKSTIVVYQNDYDHSLPMGIGDGNLSKEPTAKRYENPTVMHFVNLEQFLKDYRSKKGRPYTKWEDLTISHTAMDQFENSKSDEYYSYLHQIKQWAGMRKKQFRIKPQIGDTVSLPSFLDINDDMMNPIEIYAYYIGLYINNMRKGHGIFLDYYLSFPVTYELQIREKILKSFEKGIKKSFPESILQNDEVMKHFHINGEISEPTAYAVCALQEYEFDPQEDEEDFYGIFDFGGGTTDFDFGIWKQSSKKKYDYSIESFGAGGDKFLGGENLLEMLAFEVFKYNQLIMRENGYTFSLAPKCKEFIGSDYLLADSQESEKNMHNLKEKLRPYWEIEKQESNDEEEFAENRLDEPLDLDKTPIEIVVTLFDKNGLDHPGVKLQYTKERIDKYIETKIREGVNNFYNALILSYQNDRVKKPTKINILLAGNSCKSPIVYKVFHEEISKWESDIKKELNIENNDILFDIFPPLGTNESYEKMKNMGIDPQIDNNEKPTGKTGVAFGLIQCRKGGSIEIISEAANDNQIPFQYFIGWKSKKKFKVFKDEHRPTKQLGKPDYNVWYRFTEADVDVFELYYTTLPECISGECIVENNSAIKRMKCDIDYVDEDAFVYIRAIDPHTLEYTVSKDDDVDGACLCPIYRKELN